MTMAAPDDTPLPDAPENAADAAPAADREELTALRIRCEELQRAADQARDQLLRKAAEFENYKRRTDAEMLGIIRNATESLVASLLPVLDDFDRSLRAGREAHESDSFFRGVELIQSKLLKILEARGLSAFPSAGRPFTVEEHDALLQVPRADLTPNTVIEEVERGYRFNDRVLRHAKVVVSGPAGAGDTGGSADGDA